MKCRTDSSWYHDPCFDRCGQLISFNDDIDPDLACKECGEEEAISGTDNCDHCHRNFFKANPEELEGQTLEERMTELWEQQR